MFLGASDTGKTTCLRAAITHLARAGLLPLAIVDADIDSQPSIRLAKTGEELGRRESQAGIKLQR